MSSNNRQKSKESMLVHSDFLKPRRNIDFALVTIFQTIGDLLCHTVMSISERLTFLSN